MISRGQRHFIPFFKRTKTTVNPIVPKGGVVGTALCVVIAIMTFLACLAIGGVNLVAESARGWESQITQEATIQIKPTDGYDIDSQINKAVKLVKSFAGIKDARILNTTATQRLLEPWLGTGLELDALPIPRLIVVTLDSDTKPDFAAIAESISKNIVGGSFDNHRVWVDRLVAMAHTTVVIGLIILTLMLAALTLTVVFATRGALSGNAHIVEVLHFIGANSSFVARQFDFHFLHTALRGAALGGVSAMLVFLISSFWASLNQATPEADQLAAFFGNFSVGWTTYVEIIILIFAVAFLTMLTSRLTVMNHLKIIDHRKSELF